MQIKIKKNSISLIFEDKIKNYNLKETLKCISASKNWDYNVAWIDTSPNTKEIGRSIFDQRLFSKKEHKHSYSRDKIFN